MAEDDLSDFDFGAFWEDSDYARRTYVQPKPDADTLARVEADLKVRLPRAYVTLARHQNGGIPARTAHSAPSPTSWAEDHVAISGIFAVGFGEYGLSGTMGSRFWVEEWGYPGDLIYFADCPSAGHDMIALDYRRCGPEGVPDVVHVDQEDDYLVTPIAPDFASFIRGLVSSDTFD